MRRKIFIIGIAILLILTNAITVFASTENSLVAQVDKSELKAGETFTVTLKASCALGINSVIFTYSYDTEKLEFVEEKVATNFSKFEENNEICLLYTGAESINDADVCTITFKVKDGVAINSTANVNIGKATLIGADESVTEYEIQAQELNVKVVSDEQETPPADDSNDDEQTPPADDDNNDEQTPPADDGNDDEETPPVEDEGEDEDEEQETTEGTTVVVDGDKDDTTTSEKEYSKAGLSTMLVIGMFTIVVVAFVIYRKNKKYEDII